MFLLAALALVQILDVLSTAHLLSLPGYGEANPFARKLFERFGYWPVAIAIKIALMAAAWAVQAYIVHGWIGAAVLLAGGIFVVGSNLRHIAKAR